MKVEFNPDGSLKLPDRFAKKNKEDSEKLLNQKCVKIKREVVSHTSPKKCMLSLQISKAISDDRFVNSIFEQFNEKASVPCWISKSNDFEYEIVIGSDFRRCSECIHLIGQYREFLDGNLIEDKGNCTFKGTDKNFSYEDHFD